MKLRLTLLCALGFAAFNASACYTVYDSSSRVIYRGVETPVDLSRQIHETLGRRYPGAQLVFDQSNVCTPVAIAQVARSNTPSVPPNTMRFEQTSRGRIAPTSSGPLLTDRRTANNLHLPYTSVSGDVVVVPASAAATVRPGVTVIPSSYVTAVPGTARMGAGPAPVTGKRSTVITEMRDPPVTYIQR